MVGQKGDITTLLRRWESGDETAYREVFDLYYPHVKRIASQQLSRFRGRHMPQTTEVAHEMYGHLLHYKRRRPWRNRQELEPFFRTVIYRWLISQARRQDAIIHGGGIRPVSTDAPAALSLRAPPDLGPALRKLDAALAELRESDERLAEIVCCWIGSDLSVEQIGQQVGVSRSTAYEQLKVGKVALLKLLRD